MVSTSFLTVFRERFSLDFVFNGDSSSYGMWDDGQPIDESTNIMYREHFRPARDI